MTESEQRIMGRIEQSLTNLHEQQVRDRTERREEIKALFDRLDTITPVCIEHTVMLKGIERRAAYIGVLVAGAVSAGIAAVLRWVRP